MQWSHSSNIINVYAWFEKHTRKNCNTKYSMKTKRNGANDSEVVCCIIDAAIAIVNLFSHTTKTAAEAAAAAE